MPRSSDYYEALGVSRSANEDEIRKAYRRLARTYHPDVNKAPDAADRFAEITEAYEVLNDPEKRRNYDRFGTATPGPGGFGGRGPGGPGGGPGGPVDVADLGDIFEQMFGASGRSPFDAGRGGRPGASPAARKGRDLEHALTVSFMTAARGGAERVQLSSSDGSVQKIDVKIPAGIDSGAKLRIKGNGHPGTSGGPPGDLLVKIDVGRHPTFRREGLDLLVDVPITITEAAFGTSVTVPLLAGSAKVKVPAGTDSGQKLRIKGKGITDAKGLAGDLFAVVQIAAPADLSARARELLEELAPELQNPRESGPWT